MKSHNLEKKSAKRKRKFSQTTSVDRADTPNVERLLGRR